MIRFVLIKARKYKQLDPLGNPIYDLNSKNVVGIIPNKKLLGNPSSPIPPEILGKSIVDEDISFDVIRELGMNIS